MFTTAASPATLATTSTSATPTSPSRPSRLRGLSYLRNYTHSHLHSRDSSTSSNGSTRPHTLARATSYPAPTGTPPPGNRQGDDTTPTPRSVLTSTLQRSTTDLTGTVTLASVAGTSGGTSTVEGQSGISRAVTEPQSSILEPASPDSNIGTDNSADPVGTGMARTRSATTSRAHDLAMSGVTPQFGSVPSSSPIAAPSNPASTLPSIRFSQHQDARAPRPSLIFNSIHRTLPTGKEIIRVGRYSEREQIPNQPFNVPSAAPVGFKSKVVSRRHCEFWTQGGTWYIKDVKSSSGTFLNHVRLSPPGQESKPFSIKDGDVVQLGIDFKGGEEMIFRCVKIRIELNRNWQNSLNTFNVTSHKRLRKMAQQSPSGSSQDCSICLGQVAPCQALFVAPCSHTWHYKCVRRILNGELWPTFICPNCRAVVDLEADVDEPFEMDEEEWETAPAADAAVTEEAVAAETTPEATTEAVSATTDSGTLPSEIIGDNTTDESDTDLAMASNAMNTLSMLEVQAAIAPRDTLMTTETNLPSSPHATTAPMTIVSPRGSVSREVNSRDANARTPSPTPTGSGLSRAPGVVDLKGSQHDLNAPDGPMTPRNDIGPFVFDGSAGRPAGDASLSPSPAELASTLATSAGTIGNLAGVSNGRVSGNGS